MKSESSLVAIKGTKHGLTITLQDGPIDETLAELNDRLTRTASFFRGAQVTLNVEHAHIQPAHLGEINELLTPHQITLRKLTTQDAVLADAGSALGLQVSAGNGVALELESTPSPPPAPARAAPPPPATLGPEVDLGAAEAQYPAIVVRRTLRSGASIRHEGHIIVVGDVNPGAELIAAGDVIVWGKLRGLVHAGAMGDTNAIVCALRFEPTQLRIGNAIARMPEGRKRKSAPEIAVIRDGKIEVVEWS
jgi:septum site-determining protein MinC